MEYISLIIFKILAAIKMIAVKNCGTIASGKKNSIKINLIRTSFSFIIGLIVWLIFKRDFPSNEGLLFILIGGVAQALNMFTWILCSESVSLCVVEVFGMLGSVVLTLILAPVLYDGETVSLIQWIGCATLVVAAILFSNNKDKNNKITFGTIVLLLLCLVSSAGTTIGKKLFKTYSVGYSDEAYTLFSIVVVFIVLSILLLVFSIKKENKNNDENVDEVKVSFFKNKKVLIFIILASATLYGCEFFFVKASSIPSAILYPLSYGLGMILTFLIDFFVYKEKPTLNKIIALVLTLVSIVLTVS